MLRNDKSDSGIHKFPQPIFYGSQTFCVNPNFDPDVHFPRTIKAIVMILGIGLHFGMTTQTVVSIFDLNLYFMVFVKLHQP